MEEREVGFWGQVSRIVSGLVNEGGWTGSLICWVVVPEEYEFDYACEEVTGH